MKYPFGMLVPNRHSNSFDYRYGFQGQEKDDELKGEGNSLNYTFRMHDPRVGRFFARDPLEPKYPELTPYQFSSNTPIMAIELEGLETAFEHTMDKYYGSSAYLNASNSERREVAKTNGVAAILGLTTLIDIYVTKGKLSQAVTAYFLGDVAHSAQMQTYYRDQGNEFRAKQYEKEGAEASKVIFLGLALDGIGYGVGKLSETAGKLNLRVFRYERPDRVAGTWKINEFNVAANHRYTAPGQGGIYSSIEPETALLEISHYGAQEGRVLVYKDFSFNKVLDLTKASVRKQMGVTLKEITSDSYNVTQKLGGYAKENGYEAILAPSARKTGGTNVVIINK